MNKVVLWILVIYQIGLFFTFIGLMIAVPSDKLSKTGFRGYMDYVFQIIIWPYGLYYYTLRDYPQRSQNNFQSSTDTRE